jgi:signal transduction histidine kinase/ligand-binding sensor domain-containing protein
MPGFSGHAHVMLPYPAVLRTPGLLLPPKAGGAFLFRLRAGARNRALWFLLAIGLICPSARAAILWSDLGATLVHESGSGADILGGAVKRNDSSSDTLYFKFHIDPLSDVSTEEYFAAFELYEGNSERLAIGNSLKAWGYSAFNAAEIGKSNKIFGDIDLHSARPEPSGVVGAFLPYELPRRGIESTIVVKVQYIPDEPDLVTVWLNPDLAPGATEASQAENVTTQFKADASFNEIRLRHGGGGGGWTFSDVAIATSFNDFVTAGSAEPGVITLGAGLGALPFTFRSWQREQGLPQNSVRAIAQSRDGYIWVGNDDGVARFDGMRFISFGLREGLRSGPVRTLFGDSRGALWIGSGGGGGLTRYQDGKFLTFTMHDGLPADSITALAEDAEGRLWVGTEAGLVVWQDGRFAPLREAAEFKGRSIPALFKDRHGVMWLGIAGVGVFRFPGEKFIALTEPSVEGLLKDPHCLLLDMAGRIWIGAGDDFVLCHDSGEWRRYRIPHHLARPYVSVLAEESDGTIWAGSVSEGLFQFKGGKLAAVNASSGLSDNLVESMLVDHEGKLWVGTDAGLNRLRRKNLAAFGRNEGLGYGAVQGLAEIAPGIIWAGKPGDGLYSWDGRRFSPLAAADPGRRDPQVNALLMTRDGGCWAAGGRGLLHFKNPKSSADGEAVALAQQNVIALAEDRQGAVWAGTREGGLWRFKEKNWTQLTNHSQAHAITAIVEDADGAMWLGTEGGGLHRFKNETQTHFDKSTGLLSDLIRTLYLDAEGALWIGTAGGGLARWHDGHIMSFTSREGLPDNTISQILEDDSGRLWLGCNRGIACVTKRDLEELATGKIHTIYPQVYGRSEGMLSEECTGGFFPAGLKTKSGLLWFSTSKGVLVADPHPHKDDAPAPTIVLEEMLLDGISRPDLRLPAVSNLRGGKYSTLEEAGETVRIPPGKHRIELRYTGLSFDAPERVRFRYKLEGPDPDWVEAGMQRTASYNYVPPGEYEFRVIACNSDGVWNQRGAVMRLTVLRHFWQAGWFMGLAGIGLLISVGGGVRFVEKGKVHRRLKHLEQERALERERARIARDLHDDLGSSLTRISLLSDLAKADKDNPGQVEIHAGKISQSAAQTVRALEEIVWAVRPGSDSLQSLVEYITHFANELFEGDSARCRLDLQHNLPARPLPPEERHNLFLIVKEALTNALKHAAAKEVRVRVKGSTTSLEIVVQDDGQGFDPAAPRDGGGHHGLGNMRRRAEAAGGTLTVESAPGKGTTVRLALNFPAKTPEDTRT